MLHQPNFVLAGPSMSALHKKEYSLGSPGTGLNIKTGSGIHRLSEHPHRAAIKEKELRNKKDYAKLIGRHKGRLDSMPDRNPSRMTALDASTHPSQLNILEDTKNSRS